MNSWGGKRLVRLDRWTSAGSLHTMTFAWRVSCQGAGHVIVAPARLARQHLPHPGLLARPPQRPTPAPTVARHPVRPRPPHRHLLVPCRRHHRRVPPGLPHRLRRRPPDRRPGQQHAAGRPALAARRAADRGHRRHPHLTLRPTGRGLRHPPQPQPRARRGEVRLRPRLGHPGRPGPPPRLRHPRPALAGPTLCPLRRPGAAAPRPPPPLPH